MKKILFIFILTFIGINSSFAINFKWESTAFKDTWYCYSFSIENNENRDINDWNINFELDDKAIMYDKENWRFDNSWNEYKISWIGSNSTLEKNEKIQINFCIANSQKLPSNVSLNYEDKDNINENEIDYNYFITYPETTNSYMYIDENDDRTYDSIIWINTDNIAFSQGFWKLSYDDKNNIYEYYQDLSNIIPKTIRNTKTWYIEVFYGKKPAWPRVLWKTLLPMKIDDINSLNLNLEFNINNISNWELNFISKNKITKDSENILSADDTDIEIITMYYNDNSNIPWTKIWNFETEIIVNSKTRQENFSIYKNNWKWDEYYFVPSKNFNDDELTINLKDFLDILRNNYEDDLEDYYLMNMEVGSEYWNPSQKTSEFEWSLETFELKINWENKYYDRWDEIIEDDTNEDGDKKDTNYSNDKYTNQLSYYKKEKEIINFRNKTFARVQSKLDNYIEDKLKWSKKYNYKWIVYYRNWLINDLKDYEDSKITAWKLKARIKIYLNNILTNL